MFFPVEMKRDAGGQHLRQLDARRHASGGGARLVEGLSRGETHPPAGGARDDRDIACTAFDTITLTNFLHKNHG